MGELDPGTTVVVELKHPMGKILDFLTPEWVEKQLDERHGARGGHAGGAAALRGHLMTGLLTSVGATPDEAEWGHAARQCMNRCELEYAAGSDPKIIRDLCRDFARSFVPVMAAMDFTPTEKHIEGGMTPSDAKDLAERFGGTWWKAGGNYAGVRYWSMPQPHRLVMPRVWMIAALSGDAELARRVAEPYRLNEAHRLEVFDTREMILRHVLAGDREGERAFAAALKPGYPVDFPPDVIELPLGVIRNDPKTVLAGVKAVTTRFKGKWDLKKTRARYDKWAEKAGTKGRWSADTWDEVLDQTRKNFFNFNFVFSWWALAWLNVARWRGMDGVFRDPKAFSEWVPLSLT